MELIRQHKTKAYLGDGVYVQQDPMSGDIMLTTEDGIRVTCTIFLDSEILKNLNEWHRALFPQWYTAAKTSDRPSGSSA